MYLTLDEYHAALDARMEAVKLDMMLRPAGGEPTDGILQLKMAQRRVDAANLLNVLNDRGFTEESNGLRMLYAIATGKLKVVPV